MNTRKSIEYFRRYGTDGQYQAWCRRQPCAVTGEQVYLPETGEYRTEYAHVRRANNSGTGYKPLYSGLPLMPAVHRVQHQAGELACLKHYLPFCAVSTEQEAQQWFIDRANQYLNQWTGDR